MICSSLSYAEIYQWRDKNGNVHFGDQPPTDADTRKVNVKLNTYENTEVIDSDQWAKAASQKNNNSVVMYSTKWCGVCKKAKQYFVRNKIPYSEYDVETSEKGKRDFAKMKATGVPIIFIGSHRINGFNQAQFDAVYTKYSKVSDK